MISAANVETSKKSRDVAQTRAEASSTRINTRTQPHTSSSPSSSSSSPSHIQSCSVSCLQGRPSLGNCGKPREPPRNPHPRKGSPGALQQPLGDWEGPGKARTLITPLRCCRGILNICPLREAGLLSSVRIDISVSVI